ncbi:GerAB/ArcD/ProY family transporter [Metabacillus herbersteinensis]|uniref:GerAB/ArcD/ProY family transporter n=1 Tax=Metabacillus herbersteinensis TaxID=283816 RepID=A0ABV6GAB9_9BACI
MVKISKGQLLALIILYEIGSTTLYALGIEAKQDAWLAILIAMIVGWGLLWIYTQIQQAYPDQHLGNIFVPVCGKWIGSSLVLLYALYFFVDASFNFWEFGDTTVLLVLDGTPLSPILVVTLIVMMYAVFLGIEVIARTGEIFIPYVLFLLVSIFVLVILSGRPEFSRLQPIVENGMMPVIHAAIPQIVSFPFGEVIVFLVYWKYVDVKRGIFKTSLIAVSISGTILMIASIMMITTLGVELTSFTTIPLRELIMAENLRIDALVVISFFIGGFFKMTLNFYASVLLIQSLFSIQNLKWIILPAGICILGFSMTIFPNIVVQRWLGFEIMNVYIHPVLQVIIPCLLLLIIWLKQKVRGRSLKAPL